MFLPQGPGRSCRIGQAMRDPTCLSPRRVYPRAPHGCEAHAGIADARWKVYGYEFLPCVTACFLGYIRPPAQACMCYSVVRQARRVPPVAFGRPEVHGGTLRCARPIGAQAACGANGPFWPIAQARRGLMRDRRARPSERDGARRSGGPEAHEARSLARRCLRRRRILLCASRHSAPSAISVRTGPGSFGENFGDRTYHFWVGPRGVGLSR